MIGLAGAFFRPCYLLADQLAFIGLGSTVLSLAGVLLLPPDLARGVPLLTPLVAFASMAWLIYDRRSCELDGRNWEDQQ